MPGHIPGENHNSKDTCTPVFIEALFTIVKTRKQPKSPLPECEVAQLCLTLCDPMDCSLPGSSVHGIFQAVVLEWIVISFSRGSSQPRDQTRIVDRRFTVLATGQTYFNKGVHKNLSSCDMQITECKYLN